MKITDPDRLPVINVGPGNWERLERIVEEIIQLEFGLEGSMQGYLRSDSGRIREDDLLKEKVAHVKTDSDVIRECVRFTLDVTYDPQCGNMFEIQKLFVDDQKVESSVRTV